MNETLTSNRNMSNLFLNPINLLRSAFRDRSNNLNSLESFANLETYTGSIINSEGQQWYIKGQSGRFQPVFADYDDFRWTIWKKGFKFMFGIIDENNPEKVFFASRINESIRLTKKMSPPTSENFNSRNDPRIFLYHTSPVDGNSYIQVNYHGQLMYVSRNSNDGTLILSDRRYYWDIY